MIKIEQNGVDIYNPIAGSMPSIIDAYVSVLGEDYRQVITERVDSAVFVCLFGGGELNVMTDKQMSIRSALLQIESIIKSKYNININEINSEVELPLKLKDDELYVLYKKGIKAQGNVQKFFEDFDYSMETYDYRYDELVKILTKANIDVPEMFAKIFWSRAKKDFSMSMSQTVNIPTNDGKFKRVCLLNNATNLSMQTVIHEIGHIIDSVILKQNGKQALEKSGFAVDMQGDKTGMALNDKGKIIKTPNKGAYVAFNEIVNDYFANKVTKVLLTQGVEIGLCKVEYDATTYSKGFKVLEDFIERNMQIIIKCKMSDDLSLIGEYFGYANYNKLNSLISQYLNATQHQSEENASPYVQDLEGQILDLLCDIENRMNNMSEQSATC